MSADVVIRAEGLGKKYTIGHQSSEQYTSLRDVVAQTARNFVRTAGDMFRGREIIAGDEVEEFWALKDISFEIKRGDVVGIIGRNGAGKSTLLKVLSRITEPSEGRVEIKGRVASLLEVGTGFHPELTGRENIYLNGAILGMGREEIKRKFDEIVEFSGVEKFLDTPVKRYSSGMYVRLAFAVAAHLEPEILIVDEVLAVGDAEFQKKCLGKMQDVAGQGRTVLFVSHNMGSIRRLCQSGILLGGGSVIASSHSDMSVVDAYLSAEHAQTFWENEGTQFSNNIIYIKKITSILNKNILTISTDVFVKEKRKNLQFAIGFYSIEGELLFVSSDTDLINKEYGIGDLNISAVIDLSIFNAGTFQVRAAAYLHNEEELIGMSTGPCVTLRYEREYPMLPFWSASRPGILMPAVEWQRSK